MLRLAIHQLYYLAFPAGYAMPDVIARRDSLEVGSPVAFLVEGSWTAITVDNVVMVLAARTDEAEA